jgi:hypothetical protein
LLNIICMPYSANNQTSIDDNIASLGSVFVSYARSDISRVRPVVEFLASLGFTIWWDQFIEVGDFYRRAIQKSLDEAACVVVFWTEDSVNSNFVLDEIQKAGAQGYLVPVLLDSLDSNTQLPLGFRQHQNLDLSRWDYSDTSILTGLVQRIKALTQQGPNRYRFYSNLENSSWSINNSEQIVSDMRTLTKRVRTLSDLLSLDNESAKDLRVILGEVGKTYQAVSSAIFRFVTPAFGIGAIDTTPYLSLERTDLKNEINKGRGSCGLILDRYMRYGGLRDYIKSKCDEDTLQKADEVFTQLSSADDDMFRPLEEIGDLLRNESRVIVNLLAAKQKGLARQRILEGRTKLATLEDQLSEAVKELQQVESSLGYVQ